MADDVSTWMPWQFLTEIDTDERSTHFRLVIVSIILAAVSFLSQKRQPAPYGRFDTKDGKWGPQVNQRIAHILNDGLWGVSFFILVYFYFGRSRELVNVLFVAAWMIHFVQRGLIHPVIMRYSSCSVPLGIPVSGLTLAFFAYLHARFFGMTRYDESYTRDIRFILGSIIFVSGYAINRFSDYHLRSMRIKSGLKKYCIPRYGLFHWISCSNYFGELVEWFGWALATWSPCGVAYFLFTASTFLPRAQHTHQWYLSTFKSYPHNRKAIIPFLY